MRPPNWFLTIVAFCFVILTVLAFTTAARMSHDWQMDSDGSIFDRKTGVWCVPDPKAARTVCADMKTGKKTLVH
jgi:hypothetical protein